jgi:hypothetical protein
MGMIVNKAFKTHMNSRTAFFEALDRFEIKAAEIADKSGVPQEEV